MVDRLGKAGLEDLGLEAALQEVLDLEGEHVIETHAVLVEHADADETANEGVTLEQALGVLVVELEQLTRRTTDLGQDETDAPDLALVAKTVLAGELNSNTHAYASSGSIKWQHKRTFSSASRRADSKGRRGTFAL